MNDIDALVQTDNVLAVFAKGVQASLFTPEQRAEVKAKLHELIETNLRDDLFTQSITDQDPVFHWIDQDGSARRMYVRWDGAFLMFGDQVIRIADPFDLNTYLRQSHLSPRWVSNGVEFGFEPLPELVTTWGYAHDDDLVMKLSLVESDLRDDLGEELQDVTQSHYLQISRADMLLFLDRVLPALGRLVLTKVEPDRYSLAIQYHHNPRRRRQIPGGSIHQDEEVYAGVARLHGETLAVEKLDETQIT